MFLIIFDVLESRGEGTEMRKKCCQILDGKNIATGCFGKEVLLFQIDKANSKNRTRCARKILMKFLNPT